MNYLKIRLYIHRVYPYDQYFKDIILYNIITIQMIKIHIISNIWPTKFHKLIIYSHFMDSIRII